MWSLRKRIVITLAFIVLAVSPWWLWFKFGTSLPDFALSMIFGSLYYKAGITQLDFGYKKEYLSVFKAYNKPYLLVGPRKFEYSDSYHWDFFFVNDKQVLVSAADKGGNAFGSCGFCVFMLDDLTSYYGQLRTSIGNLMGRKESSLTYDSEKKEYKYSFSLNYPPEKVHFSIPASFFTPDMLTAESVVD